MEQEIPQEWIEMISAQQSSGKSAASWCRENGISSSTFYYRRKKVKEKCFEETETTEEKQEIVKIELGTSTETHAVPDAEKIRMIKGDVIFEFPISVTAEILSAVLRGGGGLC